MIFLSRLKAYRPLLVILVLLLIAPVFFSSDYHYRVSCLLFINAIAVTGIVVLLGFAGLISLGQAGFFGIGAYCAAILPARFGIYPIAALAIGVAASVVIAAVLGRPILRLRGHYLAIATLGLGILISIVANNERAWTGGSDGMVVAAMPIRDLVRMTGWRASTPQAWYAFLAVVMLAGLVLATNLSGSQTGRALRGLRGAPIAAETLGIDVAKYKVWAFAISAGYAGLAGALFAQFNQFVNAGVAGFLHSVELVTMAVVGGVTSVPGGFVGAAMLTLLPQALAAFNDYENAILGLIMILTMIYMGRGLVPTIWSMLQSRQDSQ